MQFVAYLFSYTFQTKRLETDGFPCWFYALQKASTDVWRMMLRQGFHVSRGKGGIPHKDREDEVVSFFPIFCAKDPSEEDNWYDDTDLASGEVFYLEWLVPKGPNTA